MNTIKIAAPQLAIVDNDKLANFHRAEKLIREAHKEGANLIVMQELHATQYFCQVEDTSYFDLAEDINGLTYQAFASLAAELDIVIVTSGFEKRAPGLYHNTAQVIDGKLGRAGIYRKMHIPDDPGFYEKFYFTPGDSAGCASGFQAVQTSIGKLGVLVCWDQWFPEAARLSALSGADLLIYPTAIGWDPTDSEDEKLRQQDAWITIQRAHAIANGLPVVAVNRVGFEPAPDCEHGGIEFWGTSFVAGPQGEVLAKASTSEEELLYATVDLKRTEEVRRIWPYLRDRRIDAYTSLDQRYLD